jgi:hypothetical protein
VDRAKKYLKLRTEPHLGRPACDLVTVPDYKIKPFHRFGKFQYGALPLKLPGISDLHYKGITKLHKGINCFLNVVHKPYKQAFLIG